MATRRTRLRGRVDDRGDCGVVALTTITGAAYTQVWSWFRAKECRDNRWNGATYREHYVYCARAFGVKLVKVRRGLGLTLRAWMDRYAEDGRTYLVCSYDHAGVVSGHEYTDTYGTGPIDERIQPPRSYVTDVWVVS